MVLSNIAEAELQVLQSIFTDSEITLDKQDRLNLLLLPEPLEPLASARNQVAVRITVAFPHGYPDESPDVDIIFKKNIDSERLENLKQLIDSLLVTHKGYECLFDLHSEITCWLQTNNTALKSMHQAMASEQPADEEEESDGQVSNEEETAGRLADKNLVTEDCRATEEQFFTWKKAFKKEMVQAGIWKDLDAEDERPTGKNLFTSGLLKSKDSLLANEEASKAQQAAAPFWQNNDLFKADDADIDPDLLEGDLSDKLSGCD